MNNHDIPQKYCPLINILVFRSINTDFCGYCLLHNHYNRRWSHYVSAQADHTMVLWLILVNMRQKFSTGVMHKAQKITYLNINLFIWGIFSPSWAVWSIFLRDYFWPEAGEERRLEDKITSEDLPVENRVVINNSHTQTFENLFKTLSAEYVTASADGSW